RSRERHIGRAGACDGSGRNVGDSDRIYSREARGARGEVQITGAEVFVLQPKIETAAEAEAESGNSLIGPCAVAEAKGLNARASDTGTDLERKTVGVAEVEQAVDHARPNVDVAAEVERARVARRVNERRGLGRAGRVEPGRDRRPERRVLAERLHVRALVSELALEPEHAEVIAGDCVDVVAPLEARFGAASRHRGN